MVLVLDASLVFSREHLVRYFILGTLLYLLVDSAEASFRFGLYEAVRDLNHGDYGGSMPGICDCTAPPCGKGAVSLVSVFGLSAATLLVDFYFTRGFSHGMKEQLALVQRVVDVSSEIAASLARCKVSGKQAVQSLPSDAPHFILCPTRKSTCKYLSNRGFWISPVSVQL